MEKKKVILEESTNVHYTNSDVEVVDKFNTMSTMIIDTHGNMIVEHGHHNTVSTEPDTKRVIKINQQEYNPLLQAFQNAFD